jgi:hypothetical protein
MSSITKDVIRDLLPVYAAGEASADTRALVEEFLAQDAELRALAEAARRIEIAAPSQAGDLQALEVESLNRTHKLLARKAWLFAVALLLSLLPLTTVFGKGGMVFQMVRDQPGLSSNWVAYAVVFWILYLATCRRLRPTGLQPQASWRARAGWSLAGALLGVDTLLVVWHWSGGRWWLALIPLVFVASALGLGRWSQGAASADAVRE